MSAILDDTRTYRYRLYRGAHPFARTRAVEVAQIFANDGIWTWCLGVTKDGSPRHPLYVPYSQPLVPWKGYER